jgi:hypothetical protein
LGIIGNIFWVFYFFSIWVIITKICLLPAQIPADGHDKWFSTMQLVSFVDTLKNTFVSAATFSGLISNGAVKYYLIRKFGFVHET